MLSSLLAGCGGTASPTTGTASACVIADVSGSTQEARGAYVSSFSALAERIGTSGSGNICVVLTAGDPQAEGPVANMYVGPRRPVADSEELTTAGRVELAVKKARKHLIAMLSEPPEGDPGSALLEAGAVAARELKPGDELLYLSDGIENDHTFGNFLFENLSPSATATLLDRLERAHLLPDLEGIPVRFPYLLYHPHGLRIGQEQEENIHRFWEAWAERAKTTLNAGTP